MQAFYNDPSWLVTLGRWMMVAFFLVVGLRNCLKPQVDDHEPREVAETHLAPRGWPAGIHEA